jgi:predicted ester cyclase
MMRGKMMSVPRLVEAFYERIWNQGDERSISELLTKDFSFRGSLGVELLGREAFKQYVQSIRTSLSNYRCEILACVTEGDQAFVKMRFSGIHVASFRGYAATGMRVEWLGAALFRLLDEAIAEVWVLGDLAGLEKALKENQESRG